MQLIWEVCDGGKAGLKILKVFREVALKLEQDGPDVVLGKGGRKHPPVEEVQVGRGVFCWDANA